MKKPVRWMKYKVFGISELEGLGWNFRTLTVMLDGSGRYVCMEFNEEFGWYPWCGTNRFETKPEAEQAIKDRIDLDKLLGA